MKQSQIWSSIASLAVVAGLASCSNGGQTEDTSRRAAVDAYNRHAVAASAPAAQMAAVAPVDPLPAPVAPAELNPSAPAAGGEGKPLAATPTAIVTSQTPTASQSKPPVAAAPPAARPGGLPPGAGRDVVQRVCTGCHAIGMVTAKGRTSDGWSEIIDRMMGLGLEASDEDLQTVHAYLSRELPPR